MKVTNQSLTVTLDSTEINAIYLALTNMSIYYAAKVPLTNDDDYWYTKMRDLKSTLEEISPIYCDAPISERRTS